MIEHDKRVASFVARSSFYQLPTPSSHMHFLVTAGNRGLGLEFVKQLTERGDRVTTTARNVRVEVDGEDAPISVETAEKSVGSVTTEEPREVPIEIDVPEDAEEGEYEIEVELEYRHTSRVFDVGGTQGDRSHTVTREVDIVIDDAPRFDLTELDTVAQIDDSGATTAEIENVGGERAEDLTVELTSTSQRVSFGDSTSETASVSSLAPGETATIEYDVRFGPRASERAYPFDATVSYEDPDGIPGTDTQATLEVTPMAEQTIGLVVGALDAGSDAEDVFETLQTEIGRLYHQRKSLRSALLVYVAVGWTTALLVVGITDAVGRQTRFLAAFPIQPGNQPMRFAV